MVYRGTNLGGKPRLSCSASIGVAPIYEQMRESRLRWFGYVQRRASIASVRKIELIQVEGTKKDRWRTKITLVEGIKKDL